MKNNCFYVFADGAAYGEEHFREQLARDAAAKAVMGGAKEAAVFKCVAIARQTYAFIDEAIAAPEKC